MASTNLKMAVDCNQYPQRALKVERFSNQWFQRHLKVAVDYNQHLPKVQKKALITKYAYFSIETCLLSYQNQPTHILSKPFTSAKYATYGI